jgi:hypothetical protein
VVTDSKSGEKLAGVTVIVTGPSLSGAQTAITDENGQYSIGNLPQGTYLTTYYYADLTIERSGIEVQKNRVTRAYQKINPAQAGGEVIRIVGRAPTIDPTSTRGHHDRQELHRNIPTPGAPSAPSAALSSDPQGRLARHFGGFQHIDRHR